MPDVRMPDGTIMRNVPEGASRDQIMQAYQRAKSSGAVAAPARPKSTFDHIKDAASNAVGGMGEGAAAIPDILWDTASGVRRYAAQGVGAVGAAGLRAVGADKAADWWQRGAQGVDSDVARQARTKPSTPITNAFPVPDNTMGRVQRFGWQMVGGSMVPIGPKASPPTVAPRPAQTAPAGLDRAARVRAARFQRVGVQKPTTGMVTRDPAAWNFERQVAKDATNGQPLQEAFKAVDDDLINAVRSQVDDLGGSIGPEATGQRVSEALGARNKQMQEAIGAAYTRARNAKGDLSVGPLDDFAAALKDPDLVDNSVFDGMVSQVGKRLQRYGVLDDNGAPVGELTIKQAEEMRKFIGNLGSTADPTTRMARGRLIEGLDETVAKGTYGDVFAAPRAMAKARFDEFKGTFPGKVAQEGIAPEKLVPRILGQATPIADIRALKTSLRTDPKGQQAWQSLRTQALDDITSGAVSPDGAVNGGALYRNFTKNAPRLRVLLEPQEYKQARSLALAARDATADVPRSYVNHSNTASTLGNMFAPPAEAAAPGVVGGIVKRQVPRVIGGLAGMLGLGPAGAPIGYGAVEAGQTVMAKRAQQAAADALRQKISLSLDPQAVASAMGDVPAAQLQMIPPEVLARYLPNAGAVAANNNMIGGLFGTRGVGPLAADERKAEDEKKKRRRP